MYTFKKKKIGKIILLSTLFIFFLLVFFSFSGTVTGDEEKVFNFVISLFKFEGSIFDWSKLTTENCEIWKNCHSSFLKHNLMWFLISNLFFEFVNFIVDVKSIINSKIIIQYFEIYFSFINSSFFWASILLLYFTYSKLFNSNLVIASLILFVFGSYIISFSTGGYIENILIFLISLRIFLKSKNIRNNSLIIYLAVIDSLLISLRFFTVWIVIYFLIENYRKFKLNNYFVYFLIIITTLFLFIKFNTLIEANSYLNTNELKNISQLEYYLIKIYRSFCVENLIEIFLVLINRVSKSFLSFSVGVFFIFPAILLLFFAKAKGLLGLKVFFLLGFIFAFSLEQNFYLPAGIAGHRGIGPYLVIFLPNMIDGLEKIYKKKKIFVTIFGSILILLFSMTLNYRHTLAHYTMFTKQQINTNLSEVLNTTEDVQKCYKTDNFSHFNFFMHPGLFAWKAFFSNLVTKEDLIIYTTSGESKLESQNIIPQSFIYRLKYLKEYDYEPYSSYFKSVTQEKDYIYLLIEVIFIISIFLQIVMPAFLFNFFLRRSKII